MMNAERADFKIYYIWMSKLFGAVLLFLVPVLLFVESFSPIWWVWTGLMTGISLFFAVFYFPIRYYKYTFCLTGEEVSVHTGVFMKTEYYFVQEKVQYITLKQGVLESFFGIYRIRIHTAGGQTDLYGLSVEQKDRLLEVLEPALLVKREETHEG